MLWFSYFKISLCSNFVFGRLHFVPVPFLHITSLIYYNSIAHHFSAQTDKSTFGVLTFSALAMKVLRFLISCQTKAFHLCSTSFHKWEESMRVKTLKWTTWMTKKTFLLYIIRLLVYACQCQYAQTNFLPAHSEVSSVWETVDS